MNTAVLNVDGKTINSTDVNYEQLVWLYSDYIDKNGKIPTTKDCVAKNNLPQYRIINEILKREGITYKDFMQKFGKISHVRASKKDYEIYLKKYIDISNNIGRALLANELIGNKYGLPSPSWFAKFCPDDSVKSYNDFVLWCGFNSNMLKKDDEQIANKLIELENNLGRPITENDISLRNTGFSMIVINRIWGTLGKCKEALGLMPVSNSNPRHFMYYKSLIDGFIKYFKQHYDRSVVSWNDIENNLSGLNINHKSLRSAFDREGVNFELYLKQNGLTMNPNSFGNTYFFPDGEKVLSLLEYDLSCYLKNELQFQYNIDYVRDVPYRDFTDKKMKSKINCDYAIYINGISFYIEVAGIIFKNNENWRNIHYEDRIKAEYQSKMIKKEKLLIDNNIRYLFLFSDDFKNNQYKNIVYTFLNMQEGDDIGIDGETQ